MNQDSRSKNILLDGIIVIVALVVTWNIYNANVNKRKSLFEEKETAQKKNEVLRQIVALEGKIDSYKVQINKNPPDSAKILNVINTMAQAAGVKLSSIKPEQRISKDFYSQDKYSLSFQVYDYHTLGKFISKLESNPDFFFAVDNVALQEQALVTTGNMPEIIVQLSVSALFIN